MLPALSSSTPWMNSGIGLRLLIVGLVRSRVLELSDKIYTFCVLFINSWRDKKQRRPSTIPTMAVSVFAWPIILLVLTVASCMSAPLLPLFTLPVVWIAFPRPLRFWPGSVGRSASSCSDSVFYQQITPVLAKTLNSAINCGALGELFCSRTGTGRLRFLSR